MSLADAPWPFAIAVTLWGASFALGCFGVDARHDGLHSNALFLQLFGDVPAQPPGSEQAMAVDRVTETVKKDLKKPSTFFKWQKWALFAGAVAFVGGHLMQMAAVPSAH